MILEAFMRKKFQKFFTSTLIGYQPITSLHVGFICSKIDKKDFQPLFLNTGKFLNFLSSFESLIKHLPFFDYPSNNYTKNYLPAQDKQFCLKIIIIIQ